MIHRSEGHCLHLKELKILLHSVLVWHMRQKSRQIVGNQTRRAFNDHLGARLLKNCFRIWHLICYWYVNDAMDRRLYFNNIAGLIAVFPFHQQCRDVLSGRAHLRNPYICDVH